MTYDEAKKEFVKTVANMSGKYSTSQVFRDFVTVAALSLQNASGCFIQKGTDFEERENTIKTTLALYTKEEQVKLARLLYLITMALEDKFGDFLGECFGLLEVNNKNVGQFFTPYCVSKLCARCVFDKAEAERTIKEKGYIGMNEPACGSGGMIMAYMDVLKNNGINYQKDCLVIANDIDQRCSYMTYIQLSLIGVPAIVTVGDTLTLKTSQTLTTLFYQMYAFKFANWKTRKQSAEAQPQTKPSELQVQNEPRQMSLF